MASTSVFFYKLSPFSVNMVLDIYNIISAYPDDDNSYFILNLLSDTELSGEYIFVQNIEESYYDQENRTFSTRIAPKANITDFILFNNSLKVYGNKTNANKLIFALTQIIKNVSINSIDYSFNSIIRNVIKNKALINKVFLEDILLTKDVIGNFTTDLSSYGEPWDILEKYKDKVIKITSTFTIGGDKIKVSFSSKGSVIIYQNQKLLDADFVELISSIIAD